jgi:Trk-type K+ transport system membrane component
MPHITNIHTANIVYDAISAITTTNNSLDYIHEIVNFPSFVKVSLIILIDYCPAAGSTGGTVKIISNTMPSIVKIMLIINMWVGRLKIIPIFVLIRAIFELFR